MHEFNNLYKTIKAKSKHTLQTQNVSEFVAVVPKRKAAAKVKPLVLRAIGQAVTEVIVTADNGGTVRISDLAANGARASKLSLRNAARIFHNKNSHYLDASHAA